jgi:hypothetical protein
MKIFGLQLGGKAVASLAALSLVATPVLVSADASAPWAEASYRVAPKRHKAHVAKRKMAVRNKVAARKRYATHRCACAAPRARVAAKSKWHAHRSHRMVRKPGSLAVAPRLGYGQVPYGAGAPPMGPGAMGPGAPYGGAAPALPGRYGPALGSAPRASSGLSSFLGVIGLAGVAAAVIAATDDNGNRFVPRVPVSP